MPEYLYSVQGTPSNLIAKALGAAEVAPGLVEGITPNEPTRLHAYLSVLARLPKHLRQTKPIIDIEREL